MWLSIHNMSLNTENSSNNVKYEFKILYALGIIFIVMGHCHGGGVSFFNEFFPFYSFHVALFVFTSGYFYKKENELRIKNFILSKTKKLIVPLYLWNIFYAIVIQILKNFDFFPSIKVNIETLLVEPIINGHQFLLNLGGWFVIPLYIVHIINILARTICFKFNIKVNEFIYFVICLFLGFAGILLSSKGFNKEWFLLLDRILYFLPFYSLGILYKKYEKYDNLNNLLYFGLIFFISLIIIYKIGYMPYVTPSWAKFHTNNVFQPFFIGFIGISFWLRISKILCPAIGKSKYINIIADNTYTIMINHLLAFKIVDTVFFLLHKYTNICAGFRVSYYKLAWNYCYLPHGKTQFLIIYVIFGIIFSIFLKKFILKITTYFTTIK